MTGVPRSGTTWLARQLAHAPGTALTGREPMNPRGRQYALGGTLHAWTTLEQPTARQRMALRTAYAGLNPWTFSRFGHRQLAAPVPGVRVIVKDPFALLAVSTITRETGAHPVVVVRHPGAVLASYRRMGWSPDLSEVAPLAARHLGDTSSWQPSGSEAEDMARFWSALHRIALPAIDASGATVVIHEDLAGGGAAAMERLYAVLGLRVTAQVRSAWTPESSTPAEVDPSRLHNFDRDPATVAQGWRRRVSTEEIEVLETIAGETLSALVQRRCPL